MAHPFDLIANFVPTRTIALEPAARALLGSSTLQSDDVAFLDASGNRDGRYDLGDFLAAVERSKGLDERQLSRAGER
jgi:hypothetical protein